MPEVWLEGPLLREDEYHCPYCKSENIDTGSLSKIHLCLACGLLWEWED